MMPFLNDPANVIVPVPTSSIMTWRRSVRKLRGSSMLSADIHPGRLQSISGLINGGIAFSTCCVPVV
jgi:hypothetical protein